MSIYGAHGISDFVTCTGYKTTIREPFELLGCDLRPRAPHDGAASTIASPGATCEPDWTRCRAAALPATRSHIGDETFCITYGDLVTDVTIVELIVFHRESEPAVILTAIQPPGRFWSLSVAGEGTAVSSFRKKLPGDGSWVNGGVFVEPEALDLVDGNSTVWEPGRWSSTGTQPPARLEARRGLAEPGQPARQRRARGGMGCGGHHAPRSGAGSARAEKLHLEQSICRFAHRGERQAGALGDREQVVRPVAQVQHP